MTAMSLLRYSGLQGACLPRGQTTLAPKVDKTRPRSTPCACVQLPACVGPSRYSSGAKSAVARHRSAPCDGIALQGHPSGTLPPSTSTRCGGSSSVFRR
ncbi:hypothetical protein BD311DRAFT_744058 [Dichomitus squalens]|uniref:Uncharacterized protein n=1 Tax=Dichomitus squalens TaxID=114155 RepID=A0A4Q9N4H8_9APHY|nr:hypothetical protein BD311DRAFT_744058 [Dichomitus squalens]